MNNEASGEETEIEHGGWGSPCAPDPSTLIKIRLDGQSEPKYAIRAFVFGEWGVHRAVRHGDHIPSSQSWDVSHIPSGLSVTGSSFAEPDFWTAIRIARALEDAVSLPADTMELTVEEACLMQAVVAAASEDHYVWPLYTEGTP